MKLKCKVLYDTAESYERFQQDQLPTIEIEIPDYNPIEHEEEYIDEENYIDIVGGDLLESLSNKTVKGFMWEKNEK